MRSSDRECDLWDFGVGSGVGRPMTRSGPLFSQGRPAGPTSGTRPVPSRPPVSGPRGVYEQGHDGSVDGTTEA